MIQSMTWSTSYLCDNYAYNTQFLFCTVSSGNKIKVVEYFDNNEKEFHDYTITAGDLGISSFSPINVHCSENI